MAATTNKTPKVYAEPDQIIILPTTDNAVNVSGRDLDGKIVYYEWKNISGPIIVTIENADKAHANVNNMVRGIYEFDLKVTATNMLFAKDRTRVMVLDSITDPLNQYCNSCYDY